MHKDTQVSLHAAHMTDLRSGMDWNIAGEMHENPSLASIAFRELFNFKVHYV